MHTRWNLSRNSDDAVIAALDDLVRTENQHVSDVLAHFAEVDARELFADRGYSSMFRYAVEHLGWSEGAARHRITAARAARRFPVLFEHVAAGAIHLSGLNVLAKHLTDANHVALLDAARRMSKRQIEELIAARFPRSDVLAMVVPQPPPPGVAAPPGETTRESSAPANGSASAAAVATPLSAESFSVTFTISRDGRDKLVEAQALLRHSIPNGNLGAIVERAIDALLARVRKQKFAETATPRARRTTSDTAPNTRHIPADVKRAVAERDGHRCTFVADDGRRCDETAWLEYHHQYPFARGGPPTADNVTLHCATHNALWARRDYGRDHIAQRQNEQGDRARDRARNRVPDRVADDAVANAQAALCQAGFSRTIARRAVTRAATELDAHASLEQLVRLSLRHTRAT